MNNNYLTLTITKDLANQKIREILTDQFKLSQKGITRLKQSPHGILINGHRVTVRHKVQTNDVLAILVNVPETPSTIVPRMMKLTIVYEDEAVLALDKPAHLPLYPRFQNDDQNLASGVLAYFAHQQGPKVFRPVGRLDKNTSGLVLIAKTADVQHWLSLQQLEKTGASWRNDNTRRKNRSAYWQIYLNRQTTRCNARREIRLYILSACSGDMRQYAVKIIISHRPHPSNPYSLPIYRTSLAG